MFQKFFMVTVDRATGFLENKQTSEYVAKLCFDNLTTYLAKADKSYQILHD